MRTNLHEYSSGEDQLLMDGHNPHDESLPFDASFQLDLEAVPRSSSWITRPVSFCGRSLSPFFTNKDLIILTVINTLAGFAFGALGTAYYEEQDRPNPDVKVFSALLMLIAFVFQTAVESNAIVVNKIESKIVKAEQKKIVAQAITPTQAWEERTRFEKVIHRFSQVSHAHENVMNLASRFSTEGILILWNVGLNVPPEDEMATQVLLNANLMLSVILLTRDVFNLWKIRPGHYVDEMNAIGRVETVNRRLSPSTEELAGKFTLYGLQTGSGLIALGLGGAYQSDVEGLGPLANCLGMIAIFDGVGYFAMEGFRRIWKRYEERWLDNDDSDSRGSLNSKPEIPLSLLILRRTGKVLHNFSTELICISSAFFSPSSPSSMLWYGALLGWFKGMMDNSAGRKFQYFSPADLQKIEQESYVEGTQSKKLAVWINRAATGTFFTLFTGFFTWGLVVSDDKERASISVLMATTYATGVGSRLVRNFFKPGENGRFFNESVFDFLFNRYSLMVPYFAFKTIGGAEGLTINEDAPFEYASGVVALGLLGAILGPLQTGEYRKVTFTPPIFRAQAFNLIYSAFHNH